MSRPPAAGRTDPSRGIPDNAAPVPASRVPVPVPVLSLFRVLFLAPALVPFPFEAL